MVRLEQHPSRKDQLILRWDGVVPPEGKDIVYYPGDMLYLWKHLKGYARWYERYQGFVLSFSSQNLERIRKQFPDLHIPPDIDREISQAKEEMRGMEELALRIKEGWYDATYNIDYKLPPLATYQHRECIYMSMIPSSPIFADCGTGKCRTGDARVSTYTGNFTLEELYERRSFHIQTSPTETVGTFDTPVHVPSLLPNGRAVWRKCDGIYRQLLRPGTPVKMVKTLHSEPFILTLSHKLLVNDTEWTDSFNVGDVIWRPAKIPERAGGFDIKESHTDKMIDSYIVAETDASALVEQYSVNAPLPCKAYFLKKFLPLVSRFYTGQNVLKTIPLKKDAVYGLADILLEFSVTCSFEPSASGMSVLYCGGKDLETLQDLIDDPSLNFFSGCAKIEDSSFYKGYKREEYLKPDRIVSCEIFTLDKATFVYDLMIPFSHNYIVDHVWSHNTYCVLVSTEHQIKQKIIKPGKTLIAGKLMTLESGWMEDAKKFTDLKVNLLWAKPGKNKKKKVLEALEDDADVYLINHDGVRVFEKELAAKNFDKVVLDESTILKSFTGTKSRRDGGTFGKALANVAHAATWRVVMSGTPAPNGPQDIWGQIHFLDPYGTLLERDYNDFLSTYMRKNVFGATIKDADGKDTFEPVHSNTPFKWVPKPGSVKKTGKVLESLAYRVKIEEHLTDLPEKTIIVRNLNMNRTQMSAYKEMKKDLETNINDELIAVQNRLVSALKLRQITGGFAIDTEGKPQALKTNPKMDMLINMIREEIDSELKVVIFAEYRWEIEQIAKTFADENAVTVYGGNSSAKNIKNVQKFINDKKTRLIVLHPKSAAHGITLTCAYYLIFYSISHSAEDNYQCVARVYRASQKHPTFIYYLLMQNSIDTTIYNVLGDKIKNQADMIDQDSIDADILGNL